MSFRAKILAGLLLGSLVPLLLMGWLSYGTSKAELRTSLGRLQGRNAEELARYTGRVVADAVQSIRLAASYLPFTELSAEEIGAVLAIPYRQVPMVNIVALFDADGSTLTTPVFRRADDASSELRAHEVITADDLELFSRSLPPLDVVIDSGTAVGPPYRSPDGSAPRVSVGVRLDTDPVMVLAVELSLGRLEQRLVELSKAAELSFMVASDDQPFATGAARLELGADERQLVAAARSSESAVVRVVRRGSGDTWLAAAAPVERLGWVVVVAQRTETAFRAAERVRSYAILWAALALVLTVLIAVVLARGLSRPIAALSRVVTALGRGEYGERVQIDRGDELGEFAETLNRMAGEIEYKDEQIQWWNRELSSQVDERTAALEAAQEQILRSRKLTALGSLGAGLAHQLNNPLTGIMGLVGLLHGELADDPKKSAMLEMVLKEARRITQIVDQFRRFTENETASAGLPVSLVKVAKEALARQIDAITAGAVRCSLRFAAATPQVLGDEFHLSQALEQLLKNALEAMPNGGDLTIETAQIGGAATIKISDTGGGIPREIAGRVFDPFFTTKVTDHNVGLGLTIVHSLIAANGGSISIDRAAQTGTTFSIILPAVPQGAHLV